MTTQTTPLEIRLTNPHAFRVVTKGGTPVLEVDTLTLALKLSGRLLLNGVDIGALAHVPITLGGGSDPALALVGQELTLADVLTPAEHTAIGAGAPHHAAVTLGGGSDPALALAGQQLTLADVLTPAEHTAIGVGAPHHAAVTLAADADVLLGLTGQQLTFDTQVMNTILAGPVAGAPADPTFRALVDADIPAGVMRDAEHLALGAAAPHHAQLHGAADHNAAVLAAGFNEDFGAFYYDIAQIAVPANPGAGVRRVFMDNATGQLSVRTAAGVTVSLEAGAGGVAAHNLLDGVVHLDTVLQGATRGSLILANSTPMWDELLVGAVGTFLRADGADAYWGAILGGDIPAIHSGTAHHVKYTNAAAVLAVEAEVTLDLTGPVIVDVVNVDTINEKGINIGVTIDGLLIKDEYIEFDEIAAPGAGAANKGRLYSVDRGGLTTLEWVDSGGVTADLSHPPVCRMRQTTVRAIASGAWVKFTLEATDKDTDSMADLANNKIVIKTAGFYMLIAHAYLTAHATGSRVVAARVNGAEDVYEAQAGGEAFDGGISDRLIAIGCRQLAVNDEVELYVYQNSGVARNTIVSAAASGLEVVWVAP